jgi:DNA-binding response OmpR family regulator
MPKFILLVDDDRASLELSRHALERAGHVVIIASDGLAAKRALDAANFDLIITDIFMPDLDGLELIRHICTSGRTMPIIAMSGGGSAATVGFLPVASALGADMVLQKPVLLRTLLEAVEQVVVDPTKRMRRKKPAPSIPGSSILGSEEPGSGPRPKLQ